MTTTETIEKSPDLLSYIVPILVPDGTCSSEKGIEDRPYDLRSILEITNEFEENEVVEQLQTLHRLIDDIQEQVHADWLGIYQVATNNDGIRVLVKLAYIGAPSRAEFPLTREFALLSNNSTVGLSGKAIVIDNVSRYDGPYYACDTRVRAEACLPIFSRDTKEVVGIIDAESFTENHFNETRVEQLTELCHHLSDFLPLSV